MLKVSITLPNGTEITCEASDPSLCMQMMAMVLQDLPRDLITMRQADSNKGSLDEKSVSTALEEMSALQPERSNGASGGPDDPESSPSPAESEFAKYCRNVTPVGDMRRVVLAAWAANHFLGTSSISDRELTHLFNLAGWRQPESFTQALRNAARSKFKWMERIPGRSGYYSVTDVGVRAVVPVQDL